MMQKAMAAFLYVWKKIMCLPAPAFLMKEFRVPDVPPEHARTAMPAAGAFFGLILTAGIALLSALCGAAGAACVAGLACALVLEAAGRWRGLGSAVRFFELKRFGSATPQALADLHADEFFRETDPVSMITSVFLWLLRAVLFGVLAWQGDAWWIVGALAGGSFVQAGLSELPSERTARPFLPVPREFSAGHFIVFGAVLLLAGILGGHVFRALCCFLAAWGLLYIFRLLLAKSLPGGIRGEHLIFCGYAAETVLLAVGLLLLG